MDLCISEMMDESSVCFVVLSFVIGSKKMPRAMFMNLISQAAGKQKYFLLICVIAFTQKALASMLKEKKMRIGRPTVRVERLGLN